MGNKLSSCSVDTYVVTIDGNTKIEDAKEAYRTAASEEAEEGIARGTLELSDQARYCSTRGADRFNRWEHDRASQLARTREEVFYCMSFRWRTSTQELRS